MSQYTQRYWRFALAILSGLLVVGCETAQPVSTVVDPVQIEEGLADLSEAAALEDQGLNESGEANGFADIYEAFTAETSFPSEAEEVDGYSPLEYALFFNGGYEASSVDIPRWLMGEKFIRFVEPVALDIFNGIVYVADAGRSAIFQYDLEKQALINFLDVARHFKGAPGGMDFSSEGYLYAADPLGKRVFKFNPQLVLVGVFEDAHNMARPGRVYYDEQREKLFVSDDVYSRVMVFNRRGDSLFAIGARGTEPGEFVGISDFRLVDDYLYVVDRFGLSGQVVTIEGDLVSRFGAEALTIPSAMAIDQYGRIYVGDEDDDSIKVFENGELKWTIGGAGIGPGKFRGINSMLIDGDRLFVLERLNRRVQVFKINSPLS